MILSMLKQETARHHDAVEEVGFSEAIMSGALTPSEYEALLYAQYQAHRQLEPLIREIGDKAGKGLPSGYAFLPRLSTLEEDIARFNRIADPVETGYLADHWSPVHFSPAEYVGACYVMEGASLGGAVILKALGRNEKLKGFSPFRFYEFQKEHGLPQWRAFSASVSAWETSPEEAQIAIRTAQSVFDVFSAAFRQVQSAASPNRY